MKQLTEQDLKPFQTRAAGELAAMIQSYPGAKGTKYSAVYDTDGDLLPFLCRLRAVTGAGKTPTLALAAKQLGSAIVLWTTNRSAIISQTQANLDTGGRYALLLPEDTRVFTLAQMAESDWTELFAATSGLTILLATVASFNRDSSSDTLKIHTTGYWHRLGTKSGEDGRNRPLYIFYDEGHGATVNQFSRLRELQPNAFVLASASPLPEDLTELLGGRTPEQREQALVDRTAAIPTPEVVKAGLLKTRLFLSDCDIADADALREANDRWNEIAVKFAEIGNDVPIAGFIVNNTLRGVAVWEELVKIGVPRERIAVHLDKAEATITDQRGSNNGLIDTYKMKKQPEQLRDEGYTHLIWNLTLSEGWDEPMAYVAYIDGKGRSINEMTQRMGRFLRQPNATPLADPDLNSAYFYFNVSDADFEALIYDMQREMTVDGMEIIPLRKREKAETSREVAVKEIREVPAIGTKFADDLTRMGDILLKSVPLWDVEERRAKGYINRRVVDVSKLEEDAALREKVERDNNASVTVYDFLMGRLQSIDKRIASNRFHGDLKTERKMRQQIQFGSEAVRQLSELVAGIRDKLQAEFRLSAKSKNSAYQVPPFKMSSPDLTGGTELQREKYRVRAYKNAVHAEYNGMNAFELAVADALDGLGLAWCRNPAVASSGYAIPIPQLGAEVENFYPDFLLWTDSKIWAIDPKGAHLKEGAAQSKLFDVANIPNMATPVHAALILQGKHTYNPNSDSWTSDKKSPGYTLVRRIYQIKTQEFDSLAELAQALLIGE